MRTALLGLALGAGLTVATTAGAATLTGSTATFLTGVSGSAVTSTTSTGLFDPFALNLPTTSILTLADNQVVKLSSAAQVNQPASTLFGSYPYSLADGYSGDLLIPVDSLGNQLLTETLTPASGSLSAFGFEVVPYSSNLGGPYNITVTLSNGQTLTQKASGGNFNTGLTSGDFFGFYGGPVSSLTITTSDPNGFAFGNFVDVPEPASMMLLATGMLGMAGLARRRG